MVKTNNRVAKWFGLVVILCFLGLPQSVKAQIVSMSEKKYQEGLKGSVGLGFNLISNTVETLMGSGKVELRYRKKEHSYTFSGDLSYSKSDEKKNVNNGSFGVMYNYQVPDRVVIAEAFSQFQYNTLQKLNGRMLLGGGPRFKLVETEELDCSLVAYTIYLRESYERKVGISNTKSLFKFSSMFSLAAHLSPTTKVSHSTYYEPDFSNLSDYRLWSNTTVKIKITSQFIFNTTFRIDYNSRVPSNVKALMYSFTNSLSYSF